LTFGVTQVTLAPSSETGGQRLDPALLDLVGPPDSVIARRPSPCGRTPVFNKRKHTWLAVLAAVTLAATGCSSDSGDSGGDAEQASSGGSDLQFTLIRHGLPSDSFWAPVQKGFEDAGKVYGIKTNFVASGNTPADEAQAIEAAVAQGVDGIAVTLPDAGAQGAAIKAAIDAGIPVVTVNSGSSTYESVGALMHIGQDEQIAGAAAGTRFKEEGAGKLLCLVHQQGNAGLDARCNGAKETFPNVEVLFVPGTDDPSGTEAAISAKLQSDADVDAVLALDPDISQFAKNAIAAAGSEAKLGTFDLSTAVLDDIKAGDILFAVNQQPYLQGYLPVGLLKLYRDNGNVVGGGLPVLTGPSLVDESTVEKTQQCVEAGNC
jgi:simple sugar transport system substrate-binding protein